MNYFDAHLHLIPEAEFYRAQKLGVTTFLLNSTRPEEWQQVLDVQNHVLGVWPCLGLHPWYVAEAASDWRFRLEDLLKQNPLAMIGEVGLDKTRPHYEEQKSAFIEQMKLAEKYGRAVIVHCVRAWADMLPILTAFKDVRVLLHRYSGDEVVVQKLRFCDVFYSVMDNRCLDVIPDNRVLVESDAPNGLKTPAMIPDLVRDLKLDPNYLRQNLEHFLE